MFVHAIRRTDGGSEVQKFWLIDLAPPRVPKKSGSRGYGEKEGSMSRGTHERNDYHSSSLEIGKTVRE